MFSRPDPGTKTTMWEIFGNVLVVGNDLTYAAVFSVLSEKNQISNTTAMTRQTISGSALFFRRRDSGAKTKKGRNIENINHRKRQLNYRRFPFLSTQNRKKIIITFLQSRYSQVGLVTQKPKYQTIILSQQSVSFPMIRALSFSA